MQLMDRRQCGLLVSSAFLVPSAFAQEVSKILQGDLATSESLLQFAMVASSDKEYASFVFESFFARQRATIDAKQSNLFRNAASAESYVRSTKGALIPGPLERRVSEESVEAQIAAIRFVASTETPLVAEVRDIHPIGIPSVEPMQVPSADSNLSVVIDIALQTIGLSEGKELADELLKDDEILELLKEIAPNLEAKDWKKVLARADKLFKLIIASSIFRKYAARFSKLIAYRLTLRCVSFLGWVYVAGCFIIALKENYHRFSFAR